MTEDAAPSLIEPTAAAPSKVSTAFGPASVAWSGVGVAARSLLLQTTRQTIGAAANDLAVGFARTSGRANDPRAVSDGYLLGAAAAAGFARALEESLATNASRRMRTNREIVRRSFLERIASPGVDVRVVVRDELEPKAPSSDQTASIVFSDAIAPSILLVLALRERFIHGRAPRVYAPDDLALPMRAALGPLIEGGFATVDEGGIEAACASASKSPGDAVVAIASSASRETLRVAIGDGREVGGFSSGAPSVIAIVPFLYGRDELGILAEHVAAELTAPPAPTLGVKLFLGRDWLQRKLFLELARAAVDRRKPNGGGEESLSVVDCECDDPKSFLDETRAGLVAFGNVPDAAPIHLLSLFAHPMPLERHAFSSALASWTERVDVPVVGIGTRASLAWTLGGPRVGPRGAAAQNGWLLEESSCITIDGRLRARVPNGARALERRARFEVAPSFANALYLGVRSAF